MTQVWSNQVANVLPESVFRRWENTQKINVMDSIHSLKVYNAVPWKEEDANLAWMLMIKNPNTEWVYVPFTKSVEINILKIRKWLNWSFNLLDEQWMIIKEWNDTKRWFAFTEEYGRYTSNKQEVFFKSNDLRMLTFKTLWEIKELCKVQILPNGKKNPFFKIALDRNNIPYNSTFISESYIVYWVFKTWENAWEHFRLFMSSSAFGQEWDPQTKVTTLVPWSLAEAISLWQKAFENLKVTQWINGYFDDSLIHTTLSVTKSWNFYKPVFSNTWLITYDNTEEFNWVEELLSLYKEQEFWAYKNTQEQLPQVQANTLQQWVAETNNQPSTNQWYYTPSAEQAWRTEQVQDTVVEEQTPVQKVQAASDMISIDEIPF